MNKYYNIGAYYFPGFHPNQYNEQWHGKGWTEWELLKAASQRFEGHQQPKVPLWGYEDESDPVVMEKKIAAAADHNIDAFIFDWYWYENGPMHERCLEEGYLHAKNNNRCKFAIMWANHGWAAMQPQGRGRPHYYQTNSMLSYEAFLKATDHIIEHYFKHPSYWRPDGKLYFSFYEMKELVEMFGNMEKARKALDEFRCRVRAAGLGELNLNIIHQDYPILPGERQFEAGDSQNQYYKELGFDSVTSYIWIHHYMDTMDFPATPYCRLREQMKADYIKFSEQLDLPYYPNITMGWDPSPRTVQSDVYENVGYPFTPTISDNTPDEFRLALVQAKEFVDSHPKCRDIITVNAWNEWTESSYLEPDIINGYGYLQAFKEIFPAKPDRQETGE